MERVEAGKPADVRAREQQSGPRDCFFGIAIKSRAAATSRRGVISLLFRGPHSHTCDLVDFAGLRGKRCLIVGGRQSAFEWAALIHEAGAAAVHVCYRHDTPAFKTAD
jgi:hypothetical protein